MKNIRLIVFVALILTLMATPHVFAQGTQPSEEVRCPANSAKPCQVIKPEILQFLEGYALDEAGMKVTKVYAQYGNNDWRRAYIAEIWGGGLPVTEFGVGLYIPRRIVVPMNDFVGIPDIGVLVQNDQIVMWPAFIAGANSDETLAELTTINHQVPLTLPVNQMIGARIGTYVWYRSDMILVFDWQLLQEGNNLVFEMHDVLIEYIPPAQYEKIEMPVSEVNTMPLNGAPMFRRGDSLTVVAVYTDTQYWQLPQMSNWKVAYDTVSYVVYQKEGSADHQVFSTADVSVTDGCGYPIWPYVGETLYVTDALLKVAVSTHPPGRMLLRESEQAEMDRRLAKGQLKIYEGTIIREMNVPEEPWGYAFLLDTASGKHRFNVPEWQIPPVDSGVVTIYTFTDTENVVAVKDSTGAWWYVETAEGPSWMCG